KVLYVVREHVVGSNPALRGEAPRRHVPLSQSANLLEARLLTYGCRSGQAELDPVVAGRIVAGGDNRPWHRQPAAGEVHHVGGGEPYVEDVCPNIGHPVRESSGQRRRGEPAILAEDDAGSRRPRSEGPTDAVGSLLVQLVGVDPA